MISRLGRLLYQMNISCLHGGGSSSRQERFAVSVFFAFVSLRPIDHRRFHPVHAQLPAEPLHRRGILQSRIPKRM